MKTKDAGFIQKHIEKLVLGAGVLFLLLIAAYAFIGNPYAVEVNGQRLAPQEAEARVLQQARQLEQRLRAEGGLEETISQRDIPSYAGDFRERIHEDILGVKHYPIPFGMAGLGLDALEPREAPDPYYVPRPWIPDEPIAHATYGVMGEVGDRNIQEQLNTFMVNNETRDFRAVSVSATFDMDAYAEEVRDGAPSGYQTLPVGWWQSKNGIAGVYLQREEWDPVAGAWSDRKIIEPLPTQIAYGLEDAARRWDADDAEYAVAHIRENQNQIIQPQFVPMVGPTTWLPPDQSRRRLSPEEQRKVNEINEQIQTIQRRIDNWERTLRQRGEETPSERLQRGGRVGTQSPDPAAPQRPTRRSRGGTGQTDEFGGYSDFWGEPTPTRNRSNDSSGEPELFTRIVSQMDRIRELERERDALYGITPQDNATQPSDGRYADDPAGNRGGRGMNNYDEFDEFDEFNEFASPGMPQRQQDGAVDRLRGEQRVWAHDLTAEPGRTYRYRVIVTMLNPLFQQRRLHPEQQEEFFNQIALWPAEEELQATEASNWSEPVTLDPEHYFFLVDGSPAREEAKVEVYRLHGGQWHFEEFNLRPGDLIGGEATIEQRTVPMYVDAMLVDLVSVTEGTSSGRGARMIYLDRETNRIRERVAEEDIDSDDRIRLRNEMERTAEVSARSAGR